MNKVQTLDFEAVEKKSLGLSVISGWVIMIFEL